MKEKLLQMIGNEITGKSYDLIDEKNGNYIRIGELSDYNPASDLVIYENRVTSGYFYKAIIDGEKEYFEFTDLEDLKEKLKINDTRINTTHLR